MMNPNDNPANHVTPRALAIARQIDQLAPGTYIIELAKVEDKAARWSVEISGTVRVKELNVYEPKEKTEIPRIVENSE
jgi:hypothetical protein